MESKRKLGPLFLSFLKIGAFTFGGGYAMIALLEREFTERKKWIGKEEFLDMVAISESTPGPVAINSATYIGYRVGGVPGSVLATLGVVLPSFLIIFVISLFLERFLSLRFVGYAFRGIQACVCYLILRAGWKMLSGTEKSPWNLIIAALAGAALLAVRFLSLGISSVWIILLFGLVGVIAYAVRAAKEKGGKH